MRTNLDDILVGATIGATPPDADIADVIPSPGQDADAFAGDVWTWIADIHALRRQGRMQDARDLAEQLGRAYEQSFDMTPKPRAAGGRQPAKVNHESMSPAELADVVRASSQIK